MSQKSRFDLLHEFERASLIPADYIASFLGAVTGPAIVLALVTAIIIWIERRWHAVGIALSALVVIGTLSTAIEVLGVLQHRSEMVLEASPEAWRGVLAAAAIELMLFGGALYALWTYSAGI